MAFYQGFHCITILHCSCSPEREEQWCDSRRYLLCPWLVEGATVCQGIGDGLQVLRWAPHPLQQMWKGGFAENGMQCKNCGLVQTCPSPRIIGWFKHALSPIMCSCVLRDEVVVVSAVLKMKRSMWHYHFLHAKIHTDGNAERSEGGGGGARHSNRKKLWH